ncbi:MAG: MBL fold metallo-hydrolase [Oscillospiraceae bacterium]|nr:MBL fold metallo-hydrolase [Oscillospiraceae bacterium]
MKKIIVSALILLLLVSCAAQSPDTGRQETRYDSLFSVVFINVGKADSILLSLKDKVYLIDTGSEESVPALYRALAVMGVKKIDGLFLTHTHSDHIGGTEALAQKVPVDRVYSAEISTNNKNGKNKIVQLARKLGLPHTQLVVGDEVAAGDGIAFKVIAPIVYNDDDDNDNSLVLMIELNGKRFLFTGDLQFAGELTVLESGADIRAHVLKVGHHGNPDATSPAFASAVSPEYAVISTDTREAKKSANPLVIANLNPATVLATQNYVCGVRMDIDADGTIHVIDLRPAQSAADMEIIGIDTDKQTITIQNNGDKTDMSGFFIFSQRGSEVFVFPEGSVIDAGQIVTVACTGGTGDYIWDEKNVWNVKNPDAGILYDSFGNELSRRQT